MQRRVCEGLWVGGGAAEFDRIAFGRTTGCAATRTAGTMNAELPLGAFSCDIGTGRLGETLQHSGIEDAAPMLLGARSAILSIIAAIFGQCGSHGCPGCMDPCAQQPAIATAGEASRLSNKEKATSLEQLFTTIANPILLDALASRM